MSELQNEKLSLPYMHHNATNRHTHTHSLHLLKKSGANRKQAYADREELTDRRASYIKKKKIRSVFFIDAECTPAGSPMTKCIVQEVLMWMTVLE